MGSHSDSDFMDTLKKRSEEMKGKNEITAGEPDEKTLASWRSNGIEVRHMPDDKQKITRISLGGGPHTPIPVDYCVIRGTVGECIDLLEKAIKALKEAP